MYAHQTPCSAQLMDFLPVVTTFAHRSGVERYGVATINGVAPSRVPEHFRALAFAQTMTYTVKACAITPKHCLLGAVGQVVPHGHSLARQTLHLGRCQRASRLAHLRNSLMSNTDCSKPASCYADEDSVDQRSVEHGVRAGLDHHRPVLVDCFQWAPFRKSPRPRFPDAHAVGSARQYPEFYLRFRTANSARMSTYSTG